MRLLRNNEHKYSEHKYSLNIHQSINLLPIYWTVGDRKHSQIRSQTNAALYCFKTTESIQKLTTLVQCGYWKRDVVASIISNSLLQFCVFSCTSVFSYFDVLHHFILIHTLSFFFVLCSFTINITIVSKEETRRRRRL